MKIQELVGFNRSSFFEGAVQLKWVDSNIKKANQAAHSYIFH